MKRRRLLASSGTIAGSLLAGCLGGGDSSGSNAGTTTTTSTATPSPTPTPGRSTTEPSPSPATDSPDSPDSPASTRSTTADQPTTRSATRSPTSPNESALRTHQLTVTDRTCGTRTEKGAIGFENDRITLTGTITGSDGCATGVLEDVTYDRAADRLRVVVATETESGGAVCTQCLTEIDYEGSVALENGVPETVVLIHRARTGETRVATASS